MTITEDLQVGYAFLNASCDGVDEQLVNNDPTKPGVTFTLGFLAHVTCTFNNTELKPGLTLKKTSTVLLGEDGIATKDDIIEYSFEVKNTGDVTLYNVTIDDFDVNVDGDPIELAPGRSRQNDLHGQVLDHPR